MQTLERERGDDKGGRGSLGTGESLLVGISSAEWWEAVKEVKHCHYVHKGLWSQRQERQDWRHEASEKAGSIVQEKGDSRQEWDGKNGEMQEIVQK